MKVAAVPSANLIPKARAGSKRLQVNLDSGRVLPIAMRYLVISALLAGCAPIRPPPDAGRSFGIEHGPMTFHNAMDAAREHCARMGLQEKHTFTDTGGLFHGHPKWERMSWFECVEG
jgi:hypothetical protein